MSACSKRYSIECWKTVEPLFLADTCLGIYSSSNHGVFRKLQGTNTRESTVNTRSWAHPAIRRLALVNVGFNEGRTMAATQLLTCPLSYVACDPRRTKPARRTLRSRLVTTRSRWRSSTACTTASAGCSGIRQGPRTSSLSRRAWPASSSVTGRRQTRARTPAWRRRRVLQRVSASGGENCRPRRVALAHPAAEHPCGIEGTRIDHRVTPR